MNITVLKDFSWDSSNLCRAGRRVFKCKNWVKVKFRLVGNKMLVNGFLAFGVGSCIFILPLCLS